jgi:hypothetical protein
MYTYIMNHHSSSFCFSLIYFITEVSICYVAILKSINLCNVLIVYHRKHTDSNLTSINLSL